MNTERIKAIQETTAYPESRSVNQALLQVWNECEQESNLRLSEQQSSHEQEMKEFAEWCDDNCWFYLGQSEWNKRKGGYTHGIVTETATTTELLTKFKNR